MACTRCGECCFPYAFAVDLDDEARRWLTYHGLIIKKMDDGKRALFGNSKCGMLYFNDDGTTGCGCYADRPTVCREYLCDKAKAG